MVLRRKRSANIFRTSATRRRTYQELSDAEESLKAALAEGFDRVQVERLAKRLVKAVKHCPDILQVDRGHCCLAMVAESRSDWKTAISHRREQLAYMAFARELAQTEIPLVRRGMLRDYAGAKVAATYDVLATNLAKAGQMAGARRARVMSRHWRRLKG